MYPKTTLYRHAKKSLDETVYDRRKQNKGRRKKVTIRDEHVIKRQILILRQTQGTFSSGELQNSCGLSETMCNATFTRVMNKLGYQWRNTRRKGKVLHDDLKKRMEFCRKLNQKKLNNIEFWSRGIALYIDAVGFEYKSNPYQHAKSIGSREWRMVSEGLDVNCTSKGCKEGKTVSSFMVGVTYEKGVVLCVPLEKRITGDYFAELIRTEIKTALAASGKMAKRILQDGDPSQNSKKARDELFKQNIRLFSIPPRSPDLNPIENLFNQVRRTIKKDSFNQQLLRESKFEFTERVRNLLLNYDTERIDNLILSMPKRVNMVLKGKGQRIKYYDISPDPPPPPRLTYCHLYYPTLPSGKKSFWGWKTFLVDGRLFL